MIRGALLSLFALAVAELLGWRANVGFFSGTVPATTFTLFTGLLYAALWFTSVVLAPVALATGLMLRIARHTGVQPPARTD